MRLKIGTTRLSGRRRPSMSSTSSECERMIHVLFASSLNETAAAPEGTAAVTGISADYETARCVWSSCDAVFMSAADLRASARFARGGTPLTSSVETP